MFRSTGPLRYSRTDDGGYKLIIEVDRDIAFYYRSLIPKWIDHQPQKYSPHISVVRREIPLHVDKWGKNEGKEIEFHYSPTIHSGKVYFWLNVFSKELEQVRLELGLPVSSEYTRPPDSFVKCFHMTLANCKCSLSINGDALGLYP